jgi:hypothetical protein
MIENLVDQYISDTYGLVVQYESGSFYDGFGNFIQNVGSGSSTINTGSFATTGSNRFIGNQTITGSLIQGAEGNQALETGSHAEGYFTIASGSYSHAEGENTRAVADYSHAEGNYTQTIGLSSHAEGYFTLALGDASHAEGYFTTASEDASHAEGSYTVASGLYSHAEGSGSIASGNSSHAEGFFTTASGNYSHAEGYFTIASEYYSHAEGYGTQAIGLASHAEGILTAAQGGASHAEGNNTTASGDYSHTEGSDTIAIGYSSHAEGQYTLASGSYSHAEGYNTIASGSNSHAEGDSTQAIGIASHAEGSITKATGDYSHAEGDNTQAKGNYSHAEGQETIASGSYSHAEGYQTIALANHQHVQGQFNAASSVPAAFIVGNGTDDGNRSNLIYAAENDVQITGSLKVTAGITGSLFGTASYASNGGVTQLLAGPNVTLSPTNGLGQVTVSSTSGGGGFNTATGSYGSFYDTTTQTNVAGTARSMSLNTTDITNGVSVSGSTNPFNTYIKTENAGVYNIQFSAQVDKTDAGVDEIWIWLRKNGTDLTDTATSIKLTGNADHQVAAWNFFANAAANDYFQLMWYSPDANVRLHAEPAFGVVPGIPSLIVTVNRVDQFLSNTGSFSGSFTGSLLGTSSYASNADLLDGLNSTVFATTGSNTFRGNQVITGSLTISGSNEPLSIINDTISYIPTSPTAITLKSAYSGSSIEFWNYDTEENSPSGIFKSGYISGNPYFADASLTFGTKYSFKFKVFGPYDYTGSIISGVNPIGTSLFDINSGQVSSSVPIVAPSLTLAAGGNLTMGTNGVLIAPAVFNTRTSTYTLQLTDNGKTIEMNSGSANNLIVPTYASVPFPIGTTINGIQLGAGQTTVSGSSGVLIRSVGGRTKTSAQYSAFTLVNRANNDWHLVGDLTT